MTTPLRHPGPTGPAKAAYGDFLQSKVVVAKSQGIEISFADIHPALYPFQRDIVRWAAMGGRRALFESFGLGKTFQQLELVRLLARSSGGKGLIVCPLGVRQEFARDAEVLGLKTRFVREPCDLLGSSDLIYLTNYETVRDGKLDPALFVVTSLDEASVLRGFGGSKTFREFMRLFAKVPYRFVATATPSPNDYIELLAYAAYLDVMDIGQAKTRFFKRDSQKADRLTIHPHKEREFWLWVSTWAIFLQRPSDLGYSDDGYDLPPIDVRWHELPSDYSAAGADRDGQLRLFPNASLGVVDAAREKKRSIGQRVAKTRAIVEASPDDHFVLWHDLEAERHAITETIPGAVEVYGSQDLDERERRIVDFSNGEIKLLATKPVISGSGCNFQRHCHRAIYTGIGFKFNDFIQSLHRLQRFLQLHPVRVDLIYTEAERGVRRVLEQKWRQHEEMMQKMSAMIREFGLSHREMAQAMTRSMGVERVEIKGDGYRLVNWDSVLETRQMESESVGLVLTSIPFLNQYEYSPNYADFGHTDSPDQFFEQMDYLTLELLRVLKPGRIAAIHVKDRITPGGINGLGFQTVLPFHCQCIEHFTAQGFAYLGMKTIVTDVVRENNQTYRLGWTEQCKDGTKMGVGMPEYLLLFRKPPSDTSNSYADEPVLKSKGDYSRSRWQIDAHGFARSNGDRPLKAEDLAGMTHAQIFQAFKRWSLEEVYDFEHHVRIGEQLEGKGLLPVTFMLLQPQSWSDEVWTDVTRMLSLNTSQAQKGAEMHLCPMQFDIADRVIAQMSNPGDVVYDPFGGLMTVPYRAIKLERYGVGCELSKQYFCDGAKYCEAAAQEAAMPSLFDALEEAV